VSAEVSSTAEQEAEARAHKLVQSPAFKKLQRDRWTVSLILLAILFVIYYGYILLLGYDKSFVQKAIGVYTNWAIVMGVAVIVGAWLLTLIYVLWANSKYDSEVDRLKKEL
jgi:uncharacterized membrane protein (DUF485 family)